jgi:protein disulfide-isomerase A1
VFFTPVAEDALAAATGIIARIAAQYSGDMKVYTIDAVSGNRFMTSIGFGRYADPAAVILVYDRAGKMTKYLHSEDDPFTYEDLAPFVEDFLDKKLKPTVRSATPPQPNDGPVYEVTANAFQKEVLESDENYILLYYEEWDRIYREFQGDFAQLAGEFRESSVRDLRFGKFEISKNDFVAGPEPKNTPFVYLFASQLKNKPIPYLGALTKKGIADFIYAELELKPREL